MHPQGTMKLSSAQSNLLGHLQGAFSFQRALLEASAVLPPQCSLLPGLDAELMWLCCYSKLPLGSSLYWVPSSSILMSSHFLTYSCILMKHILQQLPQKWCMGENFFEISH